MRKREIKLDSRRRNRSVYKGKSTGSYFRVKKVVSQKITTLAAMVWLQFTDVFYPIQRFASILANT